MSWPSCSAWAPAVLESRNEVGCAHAGSTPGLIDHDNPRAADRLRVRIEAAFGKLADMPGMGHRRTDVRDQRYHFWRVRSYIIAYRYDANDLTIVRVLHGARDFRTIFRDSTPEA